MTLNRRFSLTGTAALIITTAAGCTPHPRPLPPTMTAPAISPWTDRTFQGQEIRTEHWVVYTTALTPRWQDTLPTFLEACYWQYQQLVPAPSAPRSLTLYLFANGVQWDDYAALRGISRADIDVQSQLGGFTQRDVSAVYMDSPANTLRAIAHEGMHQYLWQHCERMPPTWVSESLAVLAEGFDQRGDRFVFEPRYNDRRFQEARVAIQKKWLLDLRDLLTLEGFQKMPNPDVAARTYLAQIWTLATFLQNDKHYRKGFEQLRQDLPTEAFHLKMEGFMAAGKPGLSPAEAAFQLYITQDLTLFWQRYYDKTIQYLGLVGY